MDAMPITRRHQTAIRRTVNRNLSMKLDFSRSGRRESNHRGEFPVLVLRVDVTYRVPIATLPSLLGLTFSAQATTAQFGWPPRHAEVRDLLVFPLR